MKWLARLGWMMAGFVLNVVVLAALYIMCFAFDSPVPDRTMRVDEPAPAKIDGLLSLETSVSESKSTIGLSDLTPYRFSDGQMGWCYTEHLDGKRIVNVQVDIADPFRARLSIASWMLRRMDDDGWYPGKSYGWQQVANSMGCPPDYADLRVEKEERWGYAIVLLIRDKDTPTESETAKVQDIEGQQDREQEFLAKRKTNADRTE